MSARPGPSHGNRVSPAAPMTPATPQTPATPTIRIEIPREEKQEEDEYRFLYPPVPLNIAQACFVMNCVLPGSGTFMMVFAVCCCADTHRWTGGDKCFAVFFALLIALLQVALAPIIIGWVWSVIWGVKYVYHARLRYETEQESDYEDDGPTELPYRRKQSLRPHLFIDPSETRPSTSSSVSSNGKRVSFAPGGSQTLKTDRDSDSGVPPSPFPYLEPNDVPPSPILPDTYRPPTGRSVSTASI